MSRVTFTERIVRRAARHQVLERLGWIYWLVLGLLGCAFLIEVVIGQMHWYVISAGTILLLACIAPLLAIRIRTRTSMARLLELNDGGVSIDIHAGRFRVFSSLGNFDIPLSRISQVSCHRDFWLLKSAAGVLLSIPIVELEWATLQGWLQELRSSGTKVQ